MNARSAVARTLLLALLAATASCGSEPDRDKGSTGGSGGGGGTGAGGGGGAGGAGGGGGAGGKAGSGPVCDPLPGFGGGEQPIAMQSVSATVLDDTGAPIVDTLAQLCGIDLCFSENTAPNGQVTVSAGGQGVKKPAFKCCDGWHHARFALLVQDPDVALGDFVVPSLPAQGADMLPGADAASGGVTLSFTSDAEIEIDGIAFPEDTPESRQFRAARFALDKAAPYLDAALGIEVVYGVGPIDTRFCPPAKVTIQNEPGWPAGTAVEFYELGLAIEQDYAPYGEWAKVSDGVVSADGATVSTNDGPDQGLRVLNAFGVRKKP